MTLYARATTIGIVTGLLTLVIVGAVLAFGGVAATGGGGIAGVSLGIAEFVLLTLATVGFIAGFAWTIRKARRRTIG